MGGWGYGQTSDFSSFCLLRTTRHWQFGRNQLLHRMNSSVHQDHFTHWLRGGGPAHRRPLPSPGFCHSSWGSGAASPLPSGFKPGESSDPMEKKKKNEGRGGPAAPPPTLVPVAAALSRRAGAPPAGGSAFGLLQFKQHVPPALGAAAAAQPREGAGRLAPCALARLLRASSRRSGNPRDKHPLSLPLYGQG